MDIKLDAEMVKALMGKAILESLPTENREQLIAKAIAYLLEPLKGSYDGGKSPVQKAFDDAIVDVARAECRRLMTESTETRAKIEKVVADAWASLMTEERHAGMVEAMAFAIRKGITGDRY